MQTVLLFKFGTFVQQQADNFAVARIGGRNQRRDFLQRSQVHIGTGGQHHPHNGYLVFFNAHEKSGLAFAVA